MKKIIIVGGGIAGLSAGIYAQQSGFDATIFEMNTIPGGNCTSWKREGYLFEGGMHWLTGSGKNQPLNKIWRELGALDDSVSVNNCDPFLTYDYNGTMVCLYRNVDKLEEHFLTVSPEDKKEISSLCKDIKRFSKMSMPVMDIKGVRVKEKSKMSISSLFTMLSVLPRLLALGKLSPAEYCQRFKHPAIRTLLQNAVGAEYSASSIIFLLACFASGDGGYPQGGSLGMALRMAKKFENSGGKIKYKNRVEKVIVENAKATGVIVNGEKILADSVIVTADTLSAIDNLFDEPLYEPWMEKMRKNSKLAMNTYIGLGVEADLSALPENLLFSLDEPFAYAGNEITTLGFHNYATYKGYAPNGCTPLTILLVGDTYNYWKDLMLKGEYEKEKQRIAAIAIDRISHKVPQIKDRVKVIDVATPLTYERYCGTYHGSYMTIVGKGDKMITYQCKPESIDCLYFAGQRMSTPGGLPIAVSTARSAVQYLCKDSNTVFQGNLR